MLTIPESDKHYDKTYVVNPSKNNIVVSETPLSFCKNLIFLNM